MISIRVTSLHATADGAAIAVSLSLSDGKGHEEKKELRVRTELFGALGIHKGEIDETRYAALEEASVLSDAYCRGAGMLAYSAKSVRQLTQKLTQKGFSREAAYKAAEMLAAHGYIHEEEDALRKADGCLSKGWGARRIMEQLRGSGYNEEALLAVEEHLAEIDFLPLCKKVARTLSRNVPADRKGRDKLAAALFRRGFSGDEIRQALSGVWSGDEE